MKVNNSRRLKNSIKEIIPGNACKLSFSIFPDATPDGGGCITRATLTTTDMSLLLYFVFTPTTG
jgi:hypothetical protein